MTAARALIVVGAALLEMAAFCTGDGSVCLQQPQNLTVDIVNTNIILKWDWDNPSCDLNVTFSAWYQEIPDYDEANLGSWTVISECQNVIVKECDLSSAVTNYLEMYIVNVTVESGEDRSSWSSLKFCPYEKAKIGPPGLQLKLVDGEVKINILHPEANQKRKMWEMDNLSYKLTIWKNSSNPEEKTQDIFSGQTIHDLEPESTYCLKIRAHERDHIALFSPVCCIVTPKARVGLPRPKNVRFHALDMEYLLYWDNLYDENVVFVVQFIRSAKRSSSADISKAWRSVRGCENITTPHCNFSSSVDASGMYYLRVQAVNSHSKSLWSKEIEFEPKKHNEMGPPSVYVNASEDSLYIFVVSPRDMYDDLYSDLSYRVWYWKNSSYNKEKIEDKSTPFRISPLTPSTLYCLKVQAFTRIYNKSSKFSNVTCTATANGKSSYQIILVAFASTLACATVMIVLFYTTYYISRKIKDVFFPSCSLPMNIENIERKDFSSCLIASEESTEKFVVVVVDSSVPDEVNLIDFKDHKQPEQISEDSGNYSNDDISGSKQSHENPEQEIQ